MLQDEGATKCNTSDPQEKTLGNWSLTASDTKLSMSDGSGNAIDADILTLNSSTLTIRYVTNYGGMTSTTVTTYNKL